MTSDADDPVPDITNFQNVDIGRIDVGHGRAIEQVELLRQPGELAASTRFIHLRSYYRADGKVVGVIRAEMASAESFDRTTVVASHQVARTFTYDTAGRRVTTTDPDSDSRTRPEPSRHWRYLFNRVGDLIAVRDPRGCGQDFFYDRAGRLLGEDYIGCDEALLDGDAPVGTLDGAIADRKSVV